jgi:nucleotide-binding universal stress UspA family protein
MDHILVPVDGSTLAESALSHAMTLAQVFAADLTLLHVMETGHIGGPGESVDPLSWWIAKNQANAYLDTLVEGLKDKGIAAQAQVLEGRAAERILSYASQNQSDCIVLSSHGQSGYGDWSMGSVARRIVGQAHGAKLLVHAQAQAEHASIDQLNPAIYHRIFVPLDGSQRAEYVLPLVTRLAQCCEAEMVTAHVIRRPEMARRIPLTDEEIELTTRVEARNRQEATDYFDQLRSQLPLLSDAHILSGQSVAAALHDMAERSKADLVVLNAHGFTGDLRWPYGSVAHSFLECSAAPVLILDDSSSGSFGPPGLTARQRTSIAPRQHEVPAHA